MNGGERAKLERELTVSIGNGLENISIQPKK
jgi:hypothetical protein